MEGCLYNYVFRGDYVDFCLRAFDAFGISWFNLVYTRGLHEVTEQIFIVLSLFGKNYLALQNHGISRGF
jgi:hypothetical protein